jgi:hypothetical protein
VYSFLKKSFDPLGKTQNAAKKHSTLKIHYRNAANNFFPPVRHFPRAENNFFHLPSILSAPKITFSARPAFYLRRKNFLRPRHLLSAPQKTFFARPITYLARGKYKSAFRCFVLSTIC